MHTRLVPKKAGRHAASPWSVVVLRRDDPALMKPANWTKKENSRRRIRASISRVGLVVWFDLWDRRPLLAASRHFKHTTTERTWWRHGRRALLMRCHRRRPSRSSSWSSRCSRANRKSQIGVECQANWSHSHSRTVALLEVASSLKL